MNEEIYDEDIPINQQQYIQQYNPFQQQNQMIPQGVYMNEQTPAMLKELLSDDHIEKNLKKKFFFIFSRDNVLTFLDEDRKRSKIMRFDILKIDALNAMPYYDYDFNSEFEWSLMRNVFDTKLDRSLGFNKQGLVNERVAQQSQFTEQRQFAEMTQDNPNKKEGWLKKLFNR